MKAKMKKMSKIEEFVAYLGFGAMVLFLLFCFMFIMNASLEEERRGDPPLRIIIEHQKGE